MTPTKSVTCINLSGSTPIGSLLGVKTGIPTKPVPVVVAIDTVTQIQTRLMSSQYEQLIKKTKFGK